MPSSTTSTASRGHALERYQMPQILRPVNSITAADLTDAADTSMGIFTIPACWGTVNILAMGFHPAATGGAQTTAGTMRLEVGAVEVDDAAGNAFVAASVVSHVAYDPVEVDLNQTTSATELSQGPVLPQASSDDKIELLVETQGVGAGDQTIYPYLIVQIANPQ